MTERILIDEWFVAGLCNQFIWRLDRQEIDILPLSMHSSRIAFSARQRHTVAQHRTWKREKFANEVNNTRVTIKISK